VALAGFHDDVAALATIAAGRASARDKLLAAEGHATVAPVAGFDSDFGFVDEHGKSVASCQWQLPVREFVSVRNTVLSCMLKAKTTKNTKVHEGLGAPGPFV
jgi:hypothetical protein